MRKSALNKKKTANKTNKREAFHPMPFRRPWQSENKSAVSYKLRCHSFVHSSNFQSKLTQPFLTFTMKHSSTAIKENLSSSYL
jgi:hypothetical protein